MTRAKKVQELEKELRQEREKLAVENMKMFVGRTFIVAESEAINEEAMKFVGHRVELCDVLDMDCVAVKVWHPNGELATIACIHPLALTEAEAWNDIVQDFYFPRQSS